MTTLMISPFAPYRDGIANYAVQEVAARRAAGEDIEVLSPLPSAARHHLVVGSPQGMVRLLRFLRRHPRIDRLVVQLYPELIFGSCRTRVERALVWLLLAVVASRVSTELRVHEVDYPTITADPVTRVAAQRALRAAAEITVHTDAERRALLDAAGDEIGPVTLVDHGKDFAPRTTATRAEARRSLGIPDDAFVFLSIGFVQRHKGFDRAVRAFGRLDREDSRLYVVGDIRTDHPDLEAYRDELERLIATTDGAERRAGYIGDEEFDRWLVAADRLVLPYREIWSSGVVERAALFDVPVIATRVGGLADQARPDTVLVTDDRELAAAMADAAGEPLAGTPAVTVGDRDGLQRLIRARAGTGHLDAAEDRPSDHLRRVPHAVLGHADSARPGVRPVKRLVQRATAWQVEPVAEAVNDLIAATIRAVSELERRDRR